MALTEFHDRSGKPIYTGDLVQYRLSGGGKNGPLLLKVIKRKRRFILADPRSGAGSIPLQKPYEQYIVIVDTSEREK